MPDELVQNQDGRHLIANFGSAAAVGNHQQAKLA
jgi:hypothetical protein